MYRYMYILTYQQATFHCHVGLPEGQFFSGCISAIAKEPVEADHNWAFLKLFGTPKSSIFQMEIHMEIPRWFFFQKIPRGCTPKIPSSSISNDGIFRNQPSISVWSSRRFGQLQTPIHICFFFEKRWSQGAQVLPHRTMTGWFAGTDRILGTSRRPSSCHRSTWRMTGGTPS